MLHHVKFALLFTGLGIFYVVGTLIALSLGLIAETLHAPLRVPVRRRSGRLRPSTMLP